MQKEEILEEIKRLATEEAVTGKVLGRTKFKKLTGITPNQWYPQYWLRWGDALIEAGFAPNTMFSRFEDEELIPLFAILIRDLGHWPLSGEVRNRCDLDSAFPTHSVMKFSRFGGKSQLAAKIVEFCEHNSGWDEVKKIAERLVQSSPEKTIKKNLKETISGHVYLLKMGKFYKIGKTNDVGRRNRELNIELPERAIVVHSISTDDPSGIEAYWHKRFSDKRTNSEWFKLDSDDVRTFTKRKLM